MKPPPYFGPHITRWAALGFDGDAAQGRYAEFRAVLSAAETPHEAAHTIRRFVAFERATVIASGVPDTDPDLWRIDAIPKYVEWQR